MAKNRGARIAALIALTAALLMARPDAGRGAAPILEPAKPQNRPVTYLHRAWGAEDGLPQSSITGIVQTRDGYIWVGTWGGLARFDGVRFTLFQTANTPGLNSDRIVCLFEDTRGVLWIGTETAGLARYKDGAFTSYSKRDGLPAELVDWIGEDHGGRLVVSTPAGSVLLDDGKVRPDPIWERFRGYQPHLYASDGSIWFQKDGVLVRYRNGDFAAYPAANIGGPIVYKNITAPFSIREDRDGTVWIAASGALFHSVNGSVTKIDTTDKVLALFAGVEGDIRFCTPDGLARFEDGKVSLYGRADFGGLFGGDRIRQAIEDREGDVWVGSKLGGLHRLRQPEITSYAPESGPPEGGFVAITQDAEGSIWAAHLAIYRLVDGALTLVLPNVSARTLFCDRDGSMWIGYTGVSRFKDGSMTSEYPETGPVRAIYRDREGTLWAGGFGSPGGLFRLTDKGFSRYGPEQGLVDANVNRIVEDRSGALWVGTEEGLSRFKDGEFTNYTTSNGLSNDYVRDVYEDGDGTLWIGTYGGGLDRFKNGKFTAITTRDGLFDNVVSSILEDDQGRFWMSCNRGIYQISRTELNDFADGKIHSVNCIAYGVGDGMASAECNGGGQPAGWKDREGRLWFPTLKGVVAVDPARSNSTSPPVVIEGVAIDRVESRAQSVLQVAPGHKDFEIRYSGLSFSAPEKVRFKYRLEGYDPGWVNAGSRRVAYYTNLAPGSYRFRVIACNNAGLWNETGASLDLYLKPHFYQTIWFYCASALLLVMLLVMLARGGYKLRVRRLTLLADTLQAKVEERTAEVVEQKNKLIKANGLLLRANDDMLSVFNQWRTAVLTTDSRGRVTFLNRSGERLFGRPGQSALDLQWRDLISLAASDDRQLSALIDEPAERRSKLTVQILGPAGPRYWVEVEVEDDPRDPRRKIFFLYDVSEVYDLRRLLDDKAKFHDLVGQSTGMVLVYQQIHDVAKVDTSVLLFGETGTGKELAARAIHYASARKNKPFVAVNCAGLTESLLGSQLFGHRRGAFTGAVADQVGLFEAAAQGTLFLDEIGDIPLSIQASLLRVLQEKEITRLGETKPRKIDARVITATHRDLDLEVTAGRFRQDLLYRIRIAEIRLPPLRERREDIPMLAAWFLGQFRSAQDAPTLEISRDAMQILLSYEWPGNVRELRSAIEAAVIRCQGPVIQPPNLPRQISARAPGRPPGPAVQVDSQQPFELTQQDRRQRVLGALDRTAGNRAAAARLLGIGRSTLYLWLEELGIKSK
jgi:transcriptional regulator with PAS, ATPase and Fis domain/ligand-binding sensor domain-containing protein